MKPIVPIVLVGPPNAIDYSSATRQDASSRSLAAWWVIGGTIALAAIAFTLIKFTDSASTNIGWLLIVLAPFVGGLIGLITSIVTLRRRSIEELAFAGIASIVLVLFGCYWALRLYERIAQHVSRMW